MTPSSGIVVAHNGAAVFGGAERWTVRLLDRLQERGHDVLLLCRDSSMVETVESFGVPAEVGRLGGHASLHHALSVAVQLRRLRPASLLLSTFKKTWLGGMAATLAGVPRVVARIGLETDRPDRRLVYRHAFERWIDRVVVNADRLRAPVLDAIPDADPAKVVTIYNGFEPVEVVGPEVLRRKLGLAADTPLVGTVARLARQKRLDRLLRIAARLPPEIHVVLAGEGALAGELRALSAELGIDDRVHFLGHTERVGEVLGALDLFLLTSEREGMSNAMLEALGAGVPVLSTPVSGAGEALDPLDGGRTPGRILEPDPELWARTIGRLLGDPSELAAMGEAGRRRARERFDWEGKVARWETLLTDDVSADVHEGPSPLSDPLRREPFSGPTY